MSENSGGQAPQTSTGASSDGDRRRNGNRHNNRRQDRQNSNKNSNPNSKFKGKIDDLEGYVYDVSGARGGTDTFQRTTIEIGEYIARNYKYAGEFRQAFNPDDLGFVEFEEPAPPADMNNPVAMKRWNLAMDRVERSTAQREELAKQAFAIVLGQCSQAVRDRLEASDELGEHQPELQCHRSPTTHQNVTVHRRDIEAFHTFA